MIRLRLTTALLVLELVFTGLLFFGAVGQAISLNDLGISRPRSLDVQVISEEQGLNGSKYAECSGDIFSLFNGRLQEQTKQWAEDTANQLLGSLKGMLVSNATCAAGNWLSKFTKFGYRPFGAFSQCDVVTSSDMKAELGDQLKNRLKSNFLVSCTSDTMRHAVTDTVTAMIQTQGLDGGMAAATDWSYFLNVRPAEIAQRQWWTILANTNICPWFRDQALTSLGVPQSYRENPPAISSMGFRTDERPPFQLRGSCTLDQDFDISDTSPEAVKKNGGWQIGLALDEEQNNPNGFIKLALEEFAKLKAAHLSAATTRYIAGGGFDGIYGECAKDPDGKCYDDGAMKQVPGAVRDIVKSDIEGLYLHLNLANGEDGLLDDVASQLQTRLLDLANAPLPFKIEFGAERDPKNFTPAPTPPPAPGTTDPNDAACTGGDARCTCVKDDPQTREIASGVIGPAIGSVMQTNPELFVPGTNQIAPGADFRAVLGAICTSIGVEVCHPHPNQDDEIVLTIGGLSTSYDVITGDGFARTDGGAPVATCSEGVQ